MPWESKKQQRWGHSPAGKKELTEKQIKEFDDSTNFDSLPEEATAGKGPTRRQGSGQKTPQIVKDLKRSSREVHKDVNQKSAGPQSTKKGGKGYNRKKKHKKSDETIGEELTPMDETYRGVGFPMAETLSWKSSGSSTGIAADLSWSTHKSETFDDTGEKGEHPAWGLKSVIDRGVKPHEKPSGAKRIEDAEHQVTKREIPGKKFKSYSMVGAFDW